MNDDLDDVTRIRSESDALALQVKTQLAERYQATDGRPWIIGFSGGKDSTLVCQLVFEALLLVPPKRRTRTVYVLSSDTRVETPYIVDFMLDSLGKMKDAAESLGLPLRTQVVSPQLNDTYWVRMIGYGYPPPSRFMRWCTERLKIKPANRFILDRISEHGEVIMLLGSRYQESQDRARSLRRHEVGDGFYRHTTMPRAYVWAPIRHFSVEEVWGYLVFHDSPWGGSNRELQQLYKNASAGECPLVVDETTEPCGNSRFGCYVCTVVDRDKSLEGFVLGGKEEYRDLLDFRNWLVALRDDDGNRQSVRRNGQPGLGPLTVAVRRNILDRLIQIQERLGEELITAQEIQVIRQAWLADSMLEDVVGLARAEP